MGECTKQADQYCRYDTDNYYKNSERFQQSFEIFANRRLFEFDFFMAGRTFFDCGQTFNQSTLDWGMAVWAGE